MSFSTLLPRLLEWERIGLTTSVLGWHARFLVRQPVYHSQRSIYAGRAAPPGEYHPGQAALFDSPVREDGSQKWVDFAAPFWHVDCVRSMSQAAFTERYCKWCKKHGYNFSGDKAAKIYAKTQDLIAMLAQGRPDQAAGLAGHIDALNAVSKTLERLKAEMLARWPSGSPSTLLSWRCAA